MLYVDIMQDHNVNMTNELSSFPRRLCCSHCLHCRLAISLFYFLILDQEQHDIL